MQNDSELIASKEPSQRKFRSRLRISLRAFLIFTAIAAVFLAIPFKQIQQQRNVSRRLSFGGISYTQSDPPMWLGFLPERWLNAYEGHWCRSIDSVNITVGPSLSGVYFKKTDHPLTYVAQLPYLRELKLSNLPFSDDQPALIGIFKSLANIRGLESLHISVFDGGYQTILSSLPDIPALKQITLYSDAPDLDSSLHGIQRLSALQHVTLMGSAIDSSGLQELASLPRLKSLNIPESPITESDLERFRNHPTLEQIVCKSTMTDEMLQILASCPNMRSIDASDSYIADQTIELLSKLRHLETLVLSRSSIGDKDFSRLVKCKSLKNIACTGCKITDAIGPMLSQVTLLESIELDKTLASGRLLPYLYKHHRLSKLRLSTAQADIATLQEFENRHPTLLASNQILYDEYKTHNPLRSVAHNWAHSRGINQENVLSMSGIVGLKGYLPEPSKLPLIHIVELSGTDIQDADLQALAASCNLHALDIEETAITAAALSSLKSQSLLESLSVGPFEDTEQAMQVITTLGSVKNLGLRGSEPLSESTLASLISMNLSSIQFPDRPFDESVTKTLCQMPNLYALTWVDRTIDYSKLTQIKLQISREKMGIPQGLRAWLIANPFAEQVTITDEREWPLLKNRKFESIHAKGVPITSAAIDALLSNQKLLYLDISGAAITSEQLKQLERLIELQTLNLNDTAINDKDVNALRFFWRLRDLGLANTHITDDGLSRLLDLPHLDKLDVSGTAITNMPWQNRSKFSGPMESSLNITGVSSAADIIKNIPATALPNKIVTHRDDDGISSESLRVLQNLRPPEALTKLDITPELLQAWSVDEIFAQKNQLNLLQLHSTNRAAEILKLACKECPNLQLLLLDHEPLLADTWSLPSRIQSIHFTHCTLTDSILDALPGCLRLRSITFDDCDLSDCQLEKLKTLPKLAELNLESTPLSQDQL